MDKTEAVLAAIEMLDNMLTFDDSSMSLVENKVTFEEVMNLPDVKRNMMVLKAYAHECVAKEKESNTENLYKNFSIDPLVLTDFTFEHDKYRLNSLLITLNNEFCGTNMKPLKKSGLIGALIKGQILAYKDEELDSRTPSREHFPVDGLRSLAFSDYAKLNGLDVEEEYYTMEGVTSSEPIFTGTTLEYIKDNLILWFTEAED